MIEISQSYNNALLKYADSYYMELIISKLNYRVAKKHGYL